MPVNGSVDRSTWVTSPSFREVSGHRIFDEAQSAVERNCRIRAGHDQRDLGGAFITKSVRAARDQPQGNAPALMSWMREQESEEWTFVPRGDQSRGNYRLVDVSDPARSPVEGTVFSIERAAKLFHRVTLGIVLVVNCSSIRVEHHAGEARDVIGDDAT